MNVSRIIAVAAVVLLLILLALKLTSNQDAAPPSGVRDTPALRDPLRASSRSPPSPPSSSHSHCLTYEQRYAQCLNIHSLPQQQREVFFLNLHRRFSSVYSREVVLLRMHRMKWSSDFWLSVCAMVTEGAGPEEGKRHVFLYTLDGHEDSIPAEFRSFIRIHPETELNRLFYFLPYEYKEGKKAGGYVHGDIACAIFLKQNPQYSFAWLFESDVRYVGSWDQFFTDSRSAAKSAKDYVPASPNNGEGARGVDAHLIFYYPRMLNYGYDFKPEDDFANDMKAWDRNFHEQWKREASQAPLPLDPAKEIHTVHGWARRRYFLRRWQKILDNATVWASAFVPAMGVSRKLAMIVYEIYLAGDGNMNQEVTLSVAAQLNGLKIVSLAGFKEFPSQFYFGFENRKESAPLYKAFVEKRPASKEDTQRYVRGQELLGARAVSSRQVMSC